MSFGIQVNINGVMVALDDSYSNLVRVGDQNHMLNAGYNEVYFNQVGHDIIAAAKHQGFGIGFLGYIYDGSNRVGMRCWSTASATIYLAYYRTFFPLYGSSCGVVVYDEHGNQTFHSDHFYLGVTNTGLLSNAPVHIHSDLYILSVHESPELNYRPWSVTTSTPIRQLQSREECTTTWEPVTECSSSYSCSYSYPDGMSCGWNEVCRTVIKRFQTCRTVWYWETVGYSYHSYGGVKCTKTLGITYQNHDGTLSKGRVTIDNDRDAYAWATSETYWDGRYENIDNSQLYIQHAPANQTIMSSPTVVISNTR